MKERQILFSLFFCIFSSAIFGTVKDGTIDLSGYDLKHNTIVLDGNWQFFYQEFLLPDYPGAEMKEKNSAYVTLPDKWNKNKAFQLNSYGTYRLRIQTDAVKQVLGFYFPDINTAYKLYINNTLIHSQGSINKTPEMSLPFAAPVYLTFYNEALLLDLILQVSNFHHPSGAGICGHVRFGSEKSINALKIRELSVEFFLLGAILFSGLYHIGLFSLARKNISYLWFGSLCVAFCIRTIFTGHRLFLELFPAFPWGVFHRLEVITIYCIALFFQFYIFSLFPGNISKHVLYCVSFFTVLYLLLILYCPLPWIVYLNNVYLFYLVAAVIYVNGVIIKSIFIDKKKEALYLLAGFIAFSITVVIDITINFAIFQIHFLSSLGFVLFLFSEYAVYTRLLKIEEHAAVLKEQLVQADKMVALGTLVAGVAHELNNPNNSILLSAQTAQDDFKLLKEGLSEYYPDHDALELGYANFSEINKGMTDSLQRIVRNSTRIKKIVESLKRYSRKEEQAVFGNVNINQIVQSTMELMENLLLKTTDQFHIHLANSIPYIKGNAQRIEQVLINIIQNSCQSLSNRTQKIAVTTKYDKTTKEVIIEIADEGKGMDEKIVKKIFDPFFTTKSAHGGTGLGLSISQKIVHEHKGKIQVQSQPNQGTIFRVIFPANSGN